MTLKHKLISVIAFILIAGVNFYLCVYLVDNMISKFPSITQANYNLKSDASPITISKLDGVCDIDYSENISFTSECEGSLVKGQMVTPVLTTFSLFSLYEVEFLDENIVHNSIESKLNVVVVSDTLAIKLFFNTDCVGKIIPLNGEYYTIVGVMRSDDNLLLDKLSKDGKERVYIPYTSLINFEDKEIHTLVYKNCSTIEPIIIQMNLSQYHFTDFSEKAKVVENFSHIISFIVYIGMSMILLYIWLLLCKRFIFNIKSDLKKHYFFQSLLSVPIQYLLLFMIGIGIPALLISVYIKFDLSLFIAPEYIPDDNIFDVSYYINHIIENSHYMNSLALIGDTYLPNLYERTFNVVSWLTGTFIVFYALLIAKIISFVINFSKTHINIST